MSELRSILEESVDRALRAAGDRSAENAMAAGEIPQPLWSEVSAMGIARALLPEAAGGAGCDWGDAGAILHIAGRHSAPLPIAEEMLGRRLLHQGGLAQPQGMVTIAPDATQVTMAEDGTLSGELPGVPWGRHAALILVELQIEGQRRLLAITGSDCGIRTDRNLAAEPRDLLLLQGKPALAHAPAPMTRVRAIAAAMRSALIAGAVQGTLEHAVTYARDRKQFGKPIAAFQAIQQQLAVLAEEALAVDVAARCAFTALDGHEGETWAAIGKIRADDAAAAAIAIAHQVHGAIGFTREHDLHLLTTRLMSWRTECGGAAEWSRLLWTRAADGPDLWEKIVGWSQAIAAD